MDNKKYPEKNLHHWLSAPFIYGTIFPFIILDISMEIYHQICFRLYKLPLVNRSEYIKIDRHKIKYFSYRDKINCAFCGYCNGLIAYVQEIAARSEKYWCGVKHQDDKNFKQPKHHQDFLEYNDKKSYDKLN